MDNTTFKKYLLQECKDFFPTIKKMNYSNTD